MHIGIRLCLFLCSSAALMFGQTGASLQLSSAAATPGATVSLQLSLMPSSTIQPVALQWDLSVPPNVVATNATIGAAATSAGKSLACAGLRCIVWGMNATTIPSGTVATVNVTLSATASGPTVVRLINLVGASVDDTSVPISAESGIITILAPLSISV